MDMYLVYRLLSENLPDVQDRVLNMLVSGILDMHENSVYEMRESEREKRSEENKRMIEAMRWALENVTKESISESRINVVKDLRNRFKLQLKSAIAVTRVIHPISEN